MGWLRDRLVRRRWSALASPEARAAGLTAAGVCDVCNAQLELAESYFLTTREVVGSEEYWVASYSRVLRLFETFGMDGEQAATVFNGQLEAMARQDTPWAVCAECAPLFVFDHEAARAHAAEGTPPPGTGPVAESECAPYAAAAWERLTGAWPASVPRP